MEDPSFTPKDSEDTGEFLAADLVLSEAIANYTDETRRGELLRETLVKVTHLTHTTHHDSSIPTNKCRYVSCRLAWRALDQAR